MSRQVPDPAKQPSAGKQRVAWIDFVRGLIIILMVFGHNMQYGSGSAVLANKLFFQDKVFQFIYSFHMPCLTLISGYLFEHTVAKKDFWSNRFRTVLLPTLIWSVIPVAEVFVRSVLSHTLSPHIIIDMFATLVSYYWFLWAILFCSVIVWMVRKWMKDSAVCYCLIGVLLILIPLKYNLYQWVYLYPYFVLGYLYKKKPFIKWQGWSKPLITVLLVAAFALLFSFYNPDMFIYTTGVTVRSLKQLYIDLYRYLIGLVGSLMTIWLSYLLYPLIEAKAPAVAKGAVYCGRVSLTIYLVDYPLSSYVLPGITKDFPFHYGITVLETAAVTLFCVGVDWLIKRSPVTRRLLLGSR